MKLNILCSAFALLFVGNMCGVVMEEHHSDAVLSDNEVVSMSVNSLSETEPVALPASLDSDLTDLKVEKLLFAIAYHWSVPNGYRIALNDYTGYVTNTSWDIMSSNHYTEVSYPNYIRTDSNFLCLPIYTYGACSDPSSSYLTSYKTTIHPDKIMFKDGEREGEFEGYACRLQYLYKYDNSSDSTIPTKYNQANNYWSHWGGDIVVATVSYNGYAANIKVDVPFLGWKTTSVVLDGVTFTLRTGPQKCSIICDRTELSNKNFDFAFSSVVKTHSIFSEKDITFS